ncbi:unnamed protein product [Prunus armeniaca]
MAVARVREMENHEDDHQRRHEQAGARWNQNARRTLYEADHTSNPKNQIGSKARQEGLQRSEHDYPWSYGESTHESCTEAREGNENLTGLIPMIETLQP